ncbi:MAG: hydrogenase expression/formation protein HypE [Roseiarcus sp.]
MTDDEFTLSCPAAAPAGDVVQLAHGGGGRMTERLLDAVFRPAFDDPLLLRRHDGARLQLIGPLAFTTDSYVVKPLIFPGGDIGALAVNGTVNDLAMCGARPDFMSAGFILEEGLSIALLTGIVASMRQAARTAGVRIVAGDLKVVDRGKADGMFINTSGVGAIVAPTPIEPQSVRPGDAVILSGDVGRHGVTVLAAREGLGFESAMTSDCAPVAEPVLALFEAGIAVHCLRDLTRGGLAGGLVEIAETAGLAIEFDERAVPVREDVGSACELLGLDPFHVANEGRFVVFAPADQADRAIAVLRRHPVSAGAVAIGAVAAGPAGRVACISAIGGTRVIDMLSGEQLPRIC